MRDWWGRRGLPERRELIARRDAERVRTAELARGKTRLKREAVERSRRRHPERESARRAVHSAVRRGDLVKAPCHCGEIKVEGHHPNYSKPLEVIWLCRQHHAELHRRAA